MDQDIAVTPEEYAEVLCTWLRMHTEETAVKTMAKYVGYKTSLFDSDRKLKFLEELIFVYTALSCYVSESILAGHESYGSIRGSCNILVHLTSPLGAKPLTRHMVLFALVTLASGHMPTIVPDEKPFMDHRLAYMMD